jgi:hypothetical protein
MIGALVATGSGATLFVLGALMNPTHAAFAYLAAYVFALTIALGALFFLTIVNTMDARWPIAIRRVVEHASATLPLFALLFIPVVLWARTLYPWTAPGVVLGVKARWLTLPAFIGRAALCFAIWCAVAWRLRAWSLAQDRGARVHARIRALSAVSLPALGLTLTSAAFDDTMSLTPAWSSTMYGIYVFAGGFVAAIAALVVLAVRTFPSLPRLQLSGLGRLLLAFIVFWAYIAYFQLFLIWMANLPREVTFYLPRLSGPWGAVSVLLAGGHFAVPFFALLPYEVKRRPRPLVAIAIWVLAMHAVDVWWLVMPAHDPDRVVLTLADPGALLLIGGAITAFGVWIARGASLVPLEARS